MMNKALTRHIARDHETPGYDPDCGDCQVLADDGTDAPFCEYCQIAIRPGLWHKPGCSENPPPQFRKRGE